MEINQQDMYKLKFNLQEEQFPYFSDEQLAFLLNEYGDVLHATYEGCLIKAQDDGIKIGPIDTRSNDKYWLRRANYYLRAIRKAERQASSGGSVVYPKRG